MKRLYYAAADPPMHAPLVRGWLHGVMCLAHLVRAITIASPVQFILSGHYAVSFTYHNIDLALPLETCALLLDCWGIAIHIAVLGWLGTADEEFHVRATWGVVFIVANGFIFSASLVLPRGVDATEYKVALLLLFLMSGTCWRSANKFHLPGAQAAAALYSLAFSLYGAARSRLDSLGKAGKHGPDLISTIQFEGYHLFQVGATLLTLHAADAL